MKKYAAFSSACAKRLTCSTAPGALSPYPSAPMASANS
ncbi:uncharacterized protein METZ01_LOCUS15293 [marine metagenome]|uniref:Uncharacterized protein n=1 Tax=marine metagenome TaxID=408172 RepID=A0A381P862_9ZZZZ